MQNGGPLSSSVTATDPEGDTLTYSLVANVTNGTLTFNSNGTFSYTPTTGYSGTDSFTYRASDGSLSDTGVYTITVTPLAATPLTIAPGAIAAWWTADDLSSMTISGGLVSSWADEVSGFALIQATTANQPAYQATGWAGSKPQVYFDGALNFLSASGVPPGAPTGTATGEVYVTVDNDAIAPGDAVLTRGILSYGGTSNTTWRGLRRTVVSSVSRLRATDGAVSVTDTSAVFEGPIAARYTYDSTNGHGVSVNGGAFTYQAATVAAGATRTRIGQSPTGTSGGWLGGVRDVVITNRALTPTEAAAMLAWQNRA